MDRLVQTRWQHDHHSIVWPCHLLASIAPLRFYSSKSFKLINHTSYAHSHNINLIKKNPFFQHNISRISLPRRMLSERLSSSSSSSFSSLRQSNLHNCSSKNNDIKCALLTEPKSKTSSKIPILTEKSCLLDYDSSYFDSEFYKNFDLQIIQDDNMNELKTLLPKFSDLPFNIFARTLDIIDSENSRLKKILILSNFFYAILISNKDLLIKIIFMILNRVAEPYENIEFGLGQQLVMKCISQITGLKQQDLQKKLATYGDLGLLLQTQQMLQKPLLKPKPLMIGQTYNSLLSIAKLSGNKSKMNKISKLQDILTAANKSEIKYVIRFILLQMRIGVGEKNILGALGRAFTFIKYPRYLFSEDLPVSTQFISKDLVDRCIKNFIISFNQCPNYSLIIDSMYNYDLENSSNKTMNDDFDLKKFDYFLKFSQTYNLRIGIPVLPMLAHPCKNFEEALTRFKDQPYIAEYKYDGERAQVHFSCDSVQIYSRNCENSTTKFPDIVEKLNININTINKLKSHEEHNKIQDFIIDCEIVGYSNETQSILPFQILSTRKRKGVEISDIKINVALIVFDILLFNGKSLIKMSLPERKQYIKLLLDNFNEEFLPDNNNIYKAKIFQSCFKEIESSEMLQSFFEESINNSCEGLMIKTFKNDSSSNYEISSRSRCWLKLKKDYLDKSGDSIDLVPIGAYIGEGKRKGMYGAFLLASYDPESEDFVAIARCGSGFSEEILKEISNEINSNESELKYQSISKPHNYNVPKHLTPDVWLCAEKVFEIRAADYTLSPLYQVAFGKIEESKGISLRFPRFIRQRSDKSPHQSTSPSDIISLYINQKTVNNTHNTGESTNFPSKRSKKDFSNDLNTSDDINDSDDDKDDIII